MIACALFESFALWQAVRENPDLRDKPLVTLDQGKIKKVSRVAAQLGIAVGMSKQGAYLRCDELYIIETDEMTLQNAWGEVLGELYGFTDRIESPKPGLAFLDLQQGVTLLADRFEIQIGIGASQEEAHLNALANGDIDAASITILESIGLSPKNTQRLEWLGIKTVGQLRRCSKSHLSRFLSKEAKTINRYFKGPFTQTVSRYIPAISLKESYTFEDAATEPYQILPVLEHLTNCLAGELGDRAATRLSITAEASGIRFSSSRLSKNALSGRLLSLSQLALRDSGVLGLEIDKLTLELFGLYRPSQQGVLWQQRENIEKAREKVQARFPGAILKLKEINPYMPVGSLAYKYTSPGGERLDRSGKARHQVSERRTHAHQRQPSLAGD